MIKYEIIILRVIIIILIFIIIILIIIIIKITYDEYMTIYNTYVIAITL